MKIEQLLPEYDYVRRYKLFVPAPPEKVYEAYKRTNFSDSKVVNALMWIRGLKRADGKNFIHDHFQHYYDDKKEVVLGLVAQPWKYRGKMKDLTLDEFSSFTEPGWTKILWNFSFEGKDGGTLVTTETRMLCTDSASRRKFKLYWTFVAPLSGWTRREILKLIRKNTLNS